MFSSSVLHLWAINWHLAITIKNDVKLLRLSFEYIAITF